MAEDYTRTNPLDHTLVSALPDEVRNVKALVIGDSAASTGGAARIFFQAAAPTVRYDGSAFDASDNGSLWIDSDDNHIYFLTAFAGPTWTDFETVIEAMTLGLSAVLTQAEAPVFTKGIVANNSYLVGRNAADDGNVDIIKVDANDVVVLPDATENATNAAPASDKDLANKKYVDDTAALQAFVTDDSDSQAMAPAHAYLTQCDGFVVAINETTEAEQTVYGYIGDSDNPAGAGTLVAINKGVRGFLSFPVTTGRYFEIVGTSIDKIIWWGIGSSDKPVDQEP